MPLLCVALCVHTSYAQKLSKVDSLKAELSRSNESNRFDVLWELAYELFDVDNPRALIYAKQAHDYAVNETGDSLEIVKSGRILGQILRRVGDVDESIQILESVLETSKRKNFERETKLILNSLAIAHTFKAEYDKALEFNFQSLVIREREGDKKQISISLNNIGLVYYKLGNFELALDYYLQSLKAKKESNDIFGLDQVLVNVGLCYNLLSKYEIANEYFEKALQSCDSSCDKEIIIQSKTGLGNSFFGQENYPQAELYFKESLDLSIKEKNQRFQIENLIELTKLYLLLDDLIAAEIYLRQIDGLGELVQYKENLLSLYELSADYYTRIKSFEQANRFQKKYSILKDSIYASRVIKNLNKVQTQFAQRENLAIIASKDQVLALNEEVITQQRALNWLLAVVIFLTSALGVMIYRNYKKATTVSTALATAKRIIEGQNLLLDNQVQEKTKELVNTNEALVKVNDELDNFIYKTSHDIRGPLASLKGMVNLAIMDVKDDKALAYLAKLDLTAEKLNTVLTRLLIVNRINHAELKPEVIHFEPIIQEILMLEMKKGIPDKIKVEYEVGQDINLVSDREMVRLILENLIDNAIKFYNDSDRVESFVKISIQSKGGRVEAHVSDNGTGISHVNRDKIFQMFVRASERSETGGIGLYLAKLATEKLGGDINFVSADENYTEFTVTFPDDLQTILEHRKEEKRRQEQEKMWVDGKTKIQSA